MLDIKRIRDDFENVKKAVESRGKGDYNIGRTIELDDKRRALLAEVEALKAEQNKASKGNSKDEEGRPRIQLLLWLK